MIVKFFDLKKINLDKNKFILFYGKNEGLKNEAINSLIKDKSNISYYEEKEILESSDNFIESILSRSLFENEKTIIIKRSSGKKLHFYTLEDQNDNIQIMASENNYLEDKLSFNEINSIIHRGDIIGV